MSDNLDTHRLIKYALEMKKMEQAGCRMINVDKVVEEIEKYSEPVRPVGWTRKIEVIEKDVVLDVLREAGRKVTNNDISTMQRV